MVFFFSAGGAAWCFSSAPEARHNLAQRVSAGFWVQRYIRYGAPEARHVSPQCDSRIYFGARCRTYGARDLFHPLAQRAGWAKA
jgi:hypothetical protein